MMSPTEVDRLSRLLNEMRVEAAREFATLSTKLEGILDVVPALVLRVEKLERHDAKAGRFTWGDIGKFTVAVGAAVSALYFATHWG